MTEFNRYRVYYYSAPQYSWDVRIDLDASPSRQRSANRLPFSFN
jgi:hypothetical protein